jgi:hypothetical protein
MARKTIEFLPKILKNIDKNNNAITGIVHRPSRIFVFRKFQNLERFENDSLEKGLKPFPSIISRVDFIHRYIIKKLIIKETILNRNIEEYDGRLPLDNPPANNKLFKATLTTIATIINNRILPKFSL